MTENNKLVPIAIVIVGLLIAGAIYYKPSIPTDSQTASLAEAKAALKKMDQANADEHLLGSISAPLKMIVYSDLECPYCKAFHFTLRQLAEKYSADNQLAIIFRQFPLTSLHQKATTEAAAAECVAQLGGNEKFWQYVDKIFETTSSNDGLDLAALPQFAKDLKIDETKFTDCQKSETTNKLVENLIKQASELRLNGTPSVIITNEEGEKFLPFYEPIPENWSAEDKAIVEDLLKTYEAEIAKLRGQ